MRGRFLRVSFVLTCVAVVIVLVGTYQEAYGQGRGMMRGGGPGMMGGMGQGQGMMGRMGQGQGMMMGRMGQGQGMMMGRMGQGPGMMGGMGQGQGMMGGMGQGQHMKSGSSQGTGQTTVNQNDPQAVLALKDQIGLTADQIKRLEKMADKGRKQAAPLLTKEQKEKLKKLPAAQTMHGTHGGMK